MEQSQEHSEPQQEEYELHRCSFHPDVETGLGCGKCGRYICPRCMVQTPVGARCSECARVATVPTFDVSSRYYIRAALAGGGVAAVAGIVAGLLFTVIPMLMWISAVGVGYMVGEAISRASNRKRGTGLAIIAGLSMTIFTVLSGLLASVMILQNLLGLLVLIAAFFIAINRVR